jgi:hypothetical protein
VQHTHNSVTTALFIRYFNQICIDFKHLDSPMSNPIVVCSAAQGHLGIVMGLRGAKGSVVAIWGLGVHAMPPFWAVF